MSSQAPMPLRRLLWSNHLPLAVFAAFILLASAAVLPRVRAFAGELATRAELGVLEPAALRQGGEHLIQAWLACLVMFYIAGACGAAVGEWSMRRIAARAAQIAADAERIAKGEALSGGAPEGSDPFARIEQALHRVSAAVVERERRLATEAARGAYQARLSRALDLASNEGATLDVARRALDLVAPGIGAELLLADSSYAHIRQVTVHREHRRGRR